MLPFLRPSFFPFLIFSHFLSFIPSFHLLYDPTVLIWKWGTSIETMTVHTDFRRLGVFLRHKVNVRRSFQTNCIKFGCSLPSILLSFFPFLIFFHCLSFHSFHPSLLPSLHVLCNTTEPFGEDWRQLRRWLFAQPSDGFIGAFLSHEANSRRFCNK